MGILQKIKKLTRQLLPTGRAFKMPDGGDGDKLISATAEENESVYNDVLSTLDVILPDNDNFTEQDATDWNLRLGMIVNEADSLADRKAAIIRKMNHPGVIPARQSADYLQDQLNAAAFTDVYVYDNPDELTIEEILAIDYPVQLGDNQLGDAQLGNIYSFYDCLSKIELGDVQLGGWQLGTTRWCDIIANNIDQETDKLFFIGTQNRTFVIGGPTFGSFCDIDSSRINEFRQLVLRIKPVNSVAYVLANYI